MALKLDAEARKLREQLGTLATPAGARLAGPSKELPKNPSLIGAPKTT